jgi:acyl carrier protein
MPNVEVELRRFVIDNFPFSELGEDLSNDASFLDQGIIDSTGVLELVTFLETTYGIRVEDDELVPDNLDSINRLLSFLERKLPHSSR